MYIMSSRGCFQ